MNKNVVTTASLALIASTFLSPLATAEDSSKLKIASKPGKLVCQSNSVKIGDGASSVELCVFGGNFSHDQYILSIDKKQVIKGIDDETTSGITATYSGNNLALTCSPQHEAPKEVSPQKIAAYQEMMKISAEDAKRMAIAAETVEVGRLCKATLGSTSLIEVQVTFE